MDIPVDLLLSIKNDRIPEDLIDGLEEQGLDENSFASFCIIMLQQIGEKASYWKPMIGTLAYIKLRSPFLVDLFPKTFNTPLYWSAEDLALLKHTFIWDEVRQTRSNFEDCYNQSVLPFMIVSSDNVIPTRLHWISIET